MGTNFLTNIDWSSPTTIGIGIGIVAVIAIASYLWWAWSEKKVAVWPIKAFRTLNSQII